MRASISEDILFIHQDDVPIYKKTGSIVRNNYFWALRSIACQSARGKDWEFDAPVWPALGRMLLFFAESGYLKLSETLLELPPDTMIPDCLRSVSSRL
jgi:hypothetical protein